MKFCTSVHPMKSDKWWPTCLGFDLEAPSKEIAKEIAWNMAIKTGMLKPKKVVVTQVTEWPR